MAKVCLASNMKSIKIQNGRMHLSSNFEINLLSKSNYLQMPWKNGKGITTEIAISPTKMGIPFQWRISRATVSSDGPFSKFPQIDRCLIVLPGGGAGIAIVSKTQSGDLKQLLPPLEPVYFSGDFETTGELIGSKIEDFNVMTERNYATAIVNVFAVTSIGIHELNRNINSTKESNITHDTFSFSSQQTDKKIPDFSFIYIADGSTNIIFKDSLKNSSCWKVHKGETLKINKNNTKSSIRTSGKEENGVNDHYSLKFEGQPSATFIKVDIFEK